MSLVSLLVAIALTVLIMGGWRRLIPLLIGRRRRALGARMLGLTNKAKFIVWAAVRGYDATPSAVQDAKAAAITNFLFGKSPRADHASQFDMQAIEHEATAWLDVNPSYCELVVQSLKVEGMALECLGESEDQFSKLIGSTIFLIYGPKFPALPDPEYYAALVGRMVADLPANQRAAIEARHW